MVVTIWWPDPTPGGRGLRHPATAPPPPGRCSRNCRGRDSHQREDNKPFPPWASSACKHQHREALRGRRPAGLSSRTAVPAPHATPAPLTHSRPTREQRGGRRPGRRGEPALHAPPPTRIPDPARLPGTPGRLSPGAVRQRGSPSPRRHGGLRAGRKRGAGGGGGTRDSPGGDVCCHGDA